MNVNNNNNSTTNSTRSNGNGNVQRLIEKCVTTQRRSDFAIANGLQILSPIIFEPLRLRIVEMLGDGRSNNFWGYFKQVRSICRMFSSISLEFYSDFLQKTIIRFTLWQACSIIPEERSKIEKNKSEKECNVALQKFNFVLQSQDIYNSEIIGDTKEKSCFLISSNGGKLAKKLAENQISKFRFM